MLELDLETYAVTDLRKSGVHPYVEDPTFEILTCAWSLDDSPVRLAIGEEEIRSLPLLGHQIVAHNSSFEQACLSTLLGRQLPPDQFIDTMALAAEHGLPRSLDKLAKALGAEGKDTAGTHLINWFSKPRKIKGRYVRMMPKDWPEKWQQFCDYCVQDVVTLKDVRRRLPGWPTEMEKRIWLADQTINGRGVRLDVDLARKAVKAAKENAARERLEVRTRAGVDNPGSIVQLLKWFNDSGLGIDDLKAETVRVTLQRENLHPDHRRVLELRQSLALSASKKFEAALAAVSEDGRIRGTFQFHGAHTGRWAGRRVQLQNLPRNDAGQAALLDLMLGLGASAQELKGLVRAMLLGPMTVVDFASIESRVLAWLAGEEWKLQAFRQGQDMYVIIATKMGGLTRPQGKIAELALGFGGGPNSLRVMAGDDDYFNGELIKLLPDQQLYDLFVYPWRGINPKIVRFWALLQAAFGEGGRAGRIRIQVVGNDRKVHLPSGRIMTYHDVKWERYRVVDPNTGLTKMKEGWRYANPQDPSNHKMRIPTYGGRLAENVTQATARDIHGEALVRLEERGYPVVLHTHDEIGVEGTEPVEKIAAIMTESPAWATGLPIEAEGKQLERYGKI